MISFKDYATGNICTIVILSLLISQTLATCPDPSHITGCTCEEEQYGHGVVTCKDFTGEQFKKFFTDLEKLEHGERHLYHVVLTGEACDELLEGTFQDISVDYIEIKDAPNFKSIHTKAFDDLNKVLVELSLTNLPSLIVTNLFDILNKLRNIELIHLENLAKLEEILTEAFKVLKKLHAVTIKGKNIKKINEKAFWNLNSMGHLEIIDTSLDKIGENIFVFSKPAEHMLTIGLYNNANLPCTGFQPGTFINIGRPTTIDFSGYHYVEEHNKKQMTCLPENVFKPFLEKHEWNDIDLYEIDFDCNNCDNAWVKKAPEEMQDRMYSIACEGGHHITDDEAFKSCK